VLPAFDIEGGLWLPLVRSVAVAALLSVFGAELFRTVCAARVFPLMPADTVLRIKTGLLRISQWSAAACVLGLLAWLLLQAADMASAVSVAQAAASVPDVLTGTMFGHLIALQIAALLAVAAALLRRMGRVALSFSGAALLLQAGHSHAASMYSGPSVLLLAQVFHLLGAGAWLGGLAPLLILVRMAPPKAGAMAARWFSPLGQVAIVALTASSLFQGWVMVASIAGLVGTAYGWMVLGKLALFGVLFVFAVLNRYRLAPSLLRGEPVAARRALVCSIAVQTGFGVAIIAAAAVLSSLTPAMHTQPLWPFAHRFTLETINEDPDFLDEAIIASLALAFAALLLIATIWLRHRMRWVMLAGAVVTTWFAAPHLDLLFVPAYPTSYYQSPTGFAAATIAEGAALYPGHCASCHGADGRGGGPAASSLKEPPADLTAAHLWMHSDGELFWWLGHGIEAPTGGLSMPGFAGVLTDDERWALIDYIRAENAGLAFRQSAAWPHPVRAPDVQAACVRRTVSLADLQGRFVRLAFGSAPVGPNPVRVTTILVNPDPGLQPGPRLCIVRDPAVAQAYAIIAGLPAGELPGTQFLIDGKGWLRAVHHPGYAPGDWNDPAVLAAKVKELRSHPLGGAAGMDHAHMAM
jgi:putative copper export protein/mono/diheme cytochrome c family protein